MKVSQIVIVPNNEGRVCDAVVRALEKWTRETRTDLRHPDKEGGGSPVDLRLRLGAQDYAIEHTRIESFGKPNRNRHRREPDRQECQEEHPGPVPRPGLLRAAVPDRRFPAGRKEPAYPRPEQPGAMGSHLRAGPARPKPGSSPAGAQSPLGQRLDPGNARWIRLRVPTVALAGRAAHPAGARRTRVPVHPPGRSGWPPPGQPATDVLQEISQASGLQEGRGTNGPGAGKRRSGSRAFRVQGWPATLAPGRL